MIFKLNTKHIFITTAFLVCGICCGTLMRYGSVRTMEQQTEVPLLIVMYHNFLNDTSRCGKYTITPKLFEQDVQYLMDNGYEFVNCSDVIDYVYNQKPMPRKPVMITIDDGYYNNYTYIFPVMQKYNIKAVISPIAYESEKYTQSQDLNPAYANMAWDNIKEMCDSGLGEVQNHSYNMHQINSKVRGCAQLPGESKKQYTDRLYADLKKAHDLIVTNTGKTPQCMVFPFGMVSNGAGDVVKKLGYKMSLSCTEGISYINQDKNCLYMLKRNNRPYGISSKEFFEEIE
ncbi:MAG: polysaccharide deacetylase family protein [Clostridia bacterium]|nr:polysaccharide deacetylase family protein [Clostridia bacterium]